MADDRDMMPLSDVDVFDRMGPAVPMSPIILSVPHAGRTYPPELLAAAAVPQSLLESLEDRFADLLITQAVNEGHVALIARQPRAWMDLNRGLDDLDPALRPPGSRSGPTTARARSGLGLIPNRLGRQHLWREPPSPAAIAERYAQSHEPYHRAIAAALQDAWRLFGHAVLIDCHSMPPLGGFRPLRIVLGDRHGRSAPPGFAARLAAAIRTERHPVGLNTPYAGAYVLDRHGQPDAGIFAIQVEIDRSLYLAPNMRDVGTGLPRMQLLIAQLAREAISAVNLTLPLAAE
jgi:N-formylglutamate amidohydrolase